MESINLYKLKNDTNCVFLSDNIIQEILNSFSKSNIKPIKTIKKQVNVMKSNKIQAKKDMNENKIIMIMNKLSNNNINELIIEYLTNILVDTEAKYDNIMNELFQKMIKDIKFIDNYVRFVMKIFIIEKKRLNLIPETFIDLIKETIMKGSELERSSCYEMIKCFCQYNFFNDKLKDYISNNVLKTTILNNYIDVYNWFNGLDKNYIELYKNDINNVIIKCNENSMNREKILIESLIDTKNIKTIEETSIIENTDIFKTMVSNILEEYIFLKSPEEVIEFINTDCNDINHKNLFCKELIIFFKDHENELENCFILIDNLIKKKVLFKSNISKGFSLYLQENDVKYNSPESVYIVNILKFLKNNNITKNIEHIFKKYKVKIFYEN